MSLDKIYSSNLQEIYYDASRSLLKNIWLEPHISFEDMKMEMKNWMEQFDKTKTKYMLTDSSIGSVVVTPVTQEWIISFLFPTVINKGVVKYALILSTEIFSRVSVEQMFDEEKEIPNDEFQQLFFENENEALSWLKD